MSTAKRWRDHAVLDQWAGYVMPLTTPYLPDGSVDYDGLSKNVERAIAIPGSAGVYAGSAYQEFWTLSVAERKRILEVVVETIDSRAPVIAGVSAMDLNTARELSEHAEQQGVTMISIWPPLYGPRTERSVIEFLETVISPLKSLVCLYSTTLSELGFYLNPRMLAELSHLDQVVAVKEGSFNLTTYLCLLDELGERMAISNSLEETWMVGKLLMPERTPDFLLASRAMYMPIGPEFFTAVAEKDFAGVLQYLSQQWALVRAIQSPSFAKGGHPLSVVKRAGELMGLAGGPVRAPLPRHSAEEEKAMIELLKQASMLD